MTMAADSRYKLTPVYRDPARGPVFALLEPLSDLSDLGLDYKVRTTTSGDVGFLDAFAVEYYGEGQEHLWWVIAYANGIIDPEIDMEVGQPLVIPGKTALARFLARRPTRAVA